MTGKELAERALDIANNYKTLYVLGCFGAPLNEKNKVRYINNQTFNGKPFQKFVGYDENGKGLYINVCTPEGAQRKQMINNASEDTFGFDCVCLIKAILWGWNGDKTKTYGGAGYAVNGVPDIGADAMMNRYCVGVSSDFSNIVVGEAVWISGHIGIYVGDGLVVECTPKWENKVQITNLGNVGKRNGNYRMWSKHGKLPWITYDSTPVKYIPTPSESNQIGKRTYIVKKGDTLTKIAVAYNTTVDKIVADNLKSHKSITRDHIVTGWKLTV